MEAVGKSSAYDTQDENLTLSSVLIKVDAVAIPEVSSES
jgi:hypothetical protein